jgi:4-hydroxy-tetrahydrodipicolinate reductase
VEALIEVIRKARGLDVDSVRFGRKGVVGVRRQDEIGIHSLRGGDVVGDHTVLFAGNGERIELIHRASDRRNFAQGAIQAVQWVLNRDPGLYSMRDVLDLG